MSALRATTILLLGLLSSVPHCTADFIGVSFDRIIENGSLNLTWDNTGLGADSFPLVVAISLINQTESGAFGVKTNLSCANSPIPLPKASLKLTALTASVNTTSYLWQGLPYPAPYLPTAQYQVEIRSAQVNTSNIHSVVARSPFFLIHQAPQPTVSSPADVSHHASYGLHGR